MSSGDQSSLHSAETKTIAKEKIAHYQRLQFKFQRCVEQLILISNKIEECQIRHNQAMMSNQKTYSDILWLRLCILKGTKQMYVYYSYKITPVLEELQDWIFGISESGLLEEIGATNILDDL